MTEANQCRHKLIRAYISQPLVTATNTSDGIAALVS